MDNEQERLARTWDAAYEIYVKHPSEQHYQIMCNAYDDLAQHTINLGVDDDQSN